jgi:hypothetical protein
MDYEKFIKRKNLLINPSGFEVREDQINDRLFPFQKALVKWAIRLGKSAIFADCGLGKTPIQLEWSNIIRKHTGKSILILAPLAVSEQTKREGEKFGIDVNVASSHDDIINGINITNYEKIHKFDMSSFVGIVLDESSILKNFAGKIRNQVIDIFITTPFKLCCTATPSPNDYTELGNTAEFLGIMTQSEMKSMFFVNDSGNTTAPWRLKGHAEKNKFWEWMSSWAIMMRQPSDLGFDNNGFILPELKWHQHIIPYTGKMSGLFVEYAKTLNEIRAAMRESLPERVKRAAELNNNSSELWLNWCNLNDESSELTKSIKGAVEVAGCHSNDIKAKAMLDFADGQIKSLVTKASIAGFGMNWQKCNNMTFVGLSHSFEALYQAVRRCWRFGQEKPVNAHIIIGEREGNVLDNILRKEHDMLIMHQNMVRNTAEFSKYQIGTNQYQKTEYNPKIEIKMPCFFKEDKS